MFFEAASLTGWRLADETKWSGMEYESGGRGEIVDGGSLTELPRRKPSTKVRELPKFYYYMTSDNILDFDGAGNHISRFGDSMGLCGANLVKRLRGTIYRNIIAYQYPSTHLATHELLCVGSDRRATYTKHAGPTHNAIKYGICLMQTCIKC